MDPAVRASLLWGLVGSLAFLVLVQGYNLVASGFVGVGPMVGVAVLVGLCSAVGTRLLGAHLLRWNESP